MKKTVKARIAALAMILVMVAAVSATAFADGPQCSKSQQMGGPPQGSMQMNGGPQMGNMIGDPLGDMGNAPHGSFGQGNQMGDFDQNWPMEGQQHLEKPEGEEDRTPPADGQQPPEKPEGEEDRTPPTDGQQPPEKPEENEHPENGQQPPEKPEDEDMTPSEVQSRPMEPNGMDPMNKIISAVNKLEDEDAKANIESLMQAHLEAMEAERNAEGDNARTEAAEALAAAQEALDKALAAAGIEINSDQQPPEKPGVDELPENGQQPLEKPEGKNMTTPDQAQNGALHEDEQTMFRLFQQFLAWLKGNNAA